MHVARRMIKKSGGEGEDAMSTIKVKFEDLSPAAQNRLIYETLLEMKTKMNATQDAIDELKPVVAGLGTAVQSMHAAVIAALANIEAAKDDPAQIQQITSDTKAALNQILTDAAALTPADQAPQPPATDPAPVDPAPVDPAPADPSTDPAPADPSTNA